MNCSMKITDFFFIFSRNLQRFIKVDTSLIIKPNNPVLKKKEFVRISQRQSKRRFVYYYNLECVFTAGVELI